jgi:hypothetical protein
MVMLVRSMYGDLAVMPVVTAFITIIGIFACVAIGATASALGVSEKPTIN